MSYVRRDGGHKLTHHPYPTPKLPPGISAQKKEWAISSSFPPKNIQRREEEKLCELSDGCRVFWALPPPPLAERERLVLLKTIIAGAEEKSSKSKQTQGPHTKPLWAHTHQVISEDHRKQTRFSDHPQRRRRRRRRPYRNTTHMGEGKRRKIHVCNQPGGAQSKKREENFFFGACLLGFGAKT